MEGWTERGREGGREGERERTEKADHNAKTIGIHTLNIYAQEWYCTYMHAHEWYCMYAYLMQNVNNVCTRVVYCTYAHEWYCMHAFMGLPVQKGRLHLHVQSTIMQIMGSSTFLNSSLPCKLSYTDTCNRY